MSEPDDDPRTPETVRLDLMVDQVAELASSVRELIDKYPQGQHQNVEVRHIERGSGRWAVIAAAAAILCMIVVIVETVRQEGERTRDNSNIQAELHDLRAWRDIHAQRIGAIEAREEKRK